MQITGNEHRYFSKKSIALCEYAEWKTMTQEKLTMFRKKPFSVELVGYLLGAANFSVHSRALSELLSLIESFSAGVSWSGSRNKVCIAVRKSAKPMVGFHVASRWWWHAVPSPEWIFGWRIAVRKTNSGGWNGYCGGNVIWKRKWPPAYGVPSGPIITPYNLFCPWQLDAFWSSGSTTDKLRSCRKGTGLVRMESKSLWSLTVCLLGVVILNSGRCTDLKKEHSKLFFRSFIGGFRNEISIHCSPDFTCFSITLGDRTTIQTT